MDDSRTETAEAAYHAAHIAFLAMSRTGREALRVAFDVREHARARWLAELDAAVDTAQDAAALEHALAERQRALTLLHAHGEMPPPLDDDVLLEIHLGEKLLARIDDAARRQGITREQILAELIERGLAHEEDRAPASDVRPRLKPP